MRKLIPLKTQLNRIGLNFILQVVYEANTGTQEMVGLINVAMTEIGKMPDILKIAHHITSHRYQVFIRINGRICDHLFLMIY